ncbi:unnamed protein product [Paramecium octaurelia]|uniref:Uncharacterized protein n=1 Tax=Paramecium octaurelia TaxID=43137 RepID=A0A8S1XTL5_PAROT|nr:unnamed protein product [Paramecium octaurelia]
MFLNQKFSNIRSKKDLNSANPYQSMKDIRHISED